MAVIGTSFDPKALRVHLDYVRKHPPTKAPPPLSDEETSEAAAQWASENSKE